MTSRISIKPIGNMGNQMLQYMCALNVRRMASNVEVFGYNLPQWNLEAPTPADFSRHALRVGSNLLNAGQLARIVRDGKVRDILLAGLGLRLENLAPAGFYQPVFTAPLEEGFDESYVVLNVRGAEILRNVHPDYHPMPFSYFDSVIANTDARPVFLGQIGDDDYSQRLRARYPNALFRPSRGAIADFQTLRASKQIALSISTFSWLAGWLSSAKIIHYPLSGMLNPLQRPDIDLAPSDDSRYRFYQFDTLKWSASEAQMTALWTGTTQHKELSANAVADLRRQAERSIRLQRTWKSLKVNVRATISCRRQATNRT